LVSPALAVTYQELQKQIDAKKQTLNNLIEQQQFYNAELEKTQGTKKP